MIRDTVREKIQDRNKEFRYRGIEPGRLENLSDAAFGMAITLILISTVPPNNFEQLRNFTWNLIPFILCIVLIMLTWYEHNVFFYRYGLRDTRIILLNTLFLIIVLFYVYPMKFLMQMVLVPISMLLQNKQLLNGYEGIVRKEDLGDLMIIYGIGASGLYFTLMLMYRYALKKAAQLELNEIEQFDTRTSMRSNFIMGAIPLLSLLLAVLFRNSWMVGLIAGSCYFLYAPLMFYHGTRADKARLRLIESTQEARKE